MRIGQTHRAARADRHRPARASAGTDCIRPPLDQNCRAAFDSYIDVDGIATTGHGIPMGINVKIGDPLTVWPTNLGNEGIDWFDNDGSCTWTFGDDLHLEDPSGACSTALRDALHNLGFDCQTLDLDGSFVDGQQVDVDLEGGVPFTGCPGADPLMKFYDANGDLFYNDGEDIVLDANNDGIFN